ncbi:MAG TPA: hypothetical protein VNR70_15455 [Steroidobacteraceae bacterium]|nr:hypothetical protein [Steroidobacteraceae bacterium]
MDEFTRSGFPNLNAAFAGIIAGGEIFAGRESAAPEPSRIAADKARSASNISKWSIYLPLECVKSMVRMGWDVST